MSELEKEFVPYQESLELKELGFDKHCFGSWETEYGKVQTYTHSISEFYKNSNHPTGKVTAPTFSQAFRWFRKKYNILATIYSNASGYLYEWHDAVGGTHRGWSEYEGPNDGGVWDTYEEAELACLRKLIKIVKNETK